MDSSTPAEDILIVLAFSPTKNVVASFAHIGFSEERVVFDVEVVARVRTRIWALAAGT